MMLFLNLGMRLPLFGPFIRNTVLVYFTGPGKLLPDIRHGAIVRIWAVINFLRSEGYRVELITISHGPFNSLLARRVDRLWVSGSEMPVARHAQWIRPTTLLKFLQRQIRRVRRLRFETRQPDNNLAAESRNAPNEPRVLSHRKPHLERLAAQVAARCQPTAIIAELLSSAVVLKGMPKNTLKILDTHDICHLQAEQALAAGDNSFPNMCTREEEIDLLRQADVIMSVQAEEQARIQNMCPDRHVILAGHAPKLRNLAAPARSRDILFVGGINRPNVHSLTRFLEVCWPKVRQAIEPAPRLVICGRVCERLPPEVEGTVYEGQVGNLELYYEKAAIVINPTLYGSGVKIKAFEALAFGKCLVSTEPGVMGLSFNDKKYPCVVTTLGRMADTIIGLLKNEAERRRYEELAWRAAQQWFQPEYVYRELSTVLSQASIRLNPGQSRYERG